MTTRRCVLLSLVLLLAIGATAQTANEPSQSELVNALLARIDKLERRVAEVEAGKSPGSTPQPQTPPAEVPPLQTLQTPSTEEVQKSVATQTHEHDEHLPNGAAAEHHFPSLQLRGFADVDFSATDEPGSHSGFNLGQFVLHVASPLSKKVAYFGELSFTAQPTSYTADVERSIIPLAVSPSHE